MGGLDISLLFVFFDPAAEKRHWLHSKVHIPHAFRIFDVTFENKLLAYGGRALRFSSYNIVLQQLFNNNAPVV